MTYSIIQVIAIFFIPLLIIRYHEFKLTKLIGTIGMAYLLGLIVALFVFGLRKLGVNVVQNQDIGEIGSHLAISIAIPLLLFSANLKEAKKLSKSVLLAFGSVILSVLIVTTLTFLIYGKTLNNGAELSGMAIGLYTGGTPNLNAIANVFGLDSITIGIANLSDMIIGGTFYMFLLILCKPLLLKFLKPTSSSDYLKEASNITNTEELNIKEFRTSKPLVKAFFLAFLMAVIGALLGILLWVILGAVEGKMTDLLVPTMMISVTVFGIIASFNKKIRETKGTNVVGQYLILVFSFALASSLDLTKMTGNFGKVLLLYGIITIGSFILHIIFSKLLRIDVDCAIVTATAGIYGPAFIPAITKQIKNDSLTVPGLICGSIGYAIGTFIGVGIGLLFML
ncbi:MAG: hypothetical protein CVV56_03105 [Tenericutes bacterium HGW-Tenericutes-1]|jgi:uncharacterized membrane protein|nr:MAG: hypothetical protein CVV56_03105 [Tenericutes bacterium HGW-Tenericutes-1]